MRSFQWQLGCFAVLALYLSGSEARAQEGLVKISVETSPPGASVYVDDKSTGIQCQSGPSCKLRLKKGTHRLILELDGFKPSEQTVNVSTPQKYAFKLQGAPATLELLTLATNQSGQGAEVYVDGKLAGTVPGNIQVPNGKHMLEIKRAGFQALTEQIEVKGGEARPVYVALSAVTKESPTSGSLMVSAAAPAEVVVDDQPRGPAPVLVASLSPGDHVVDIVPQTPGLVPWRRNVRVTAGEQSRAHGTFQAAPEQPQAPPPQENRVPVAIVPRNPKYTYVVTMGLAQSCTTPCTVMVAPGPSAVAVNGPGSKSFRKQIMIPNAPSQLAVQHFTLSRVISGPLLTVMGLGALAGGSLLVVAAPSSDVVLLSSGGVVLAHGIAFTAAGIGELARIKLNRVDVQGLGPVAAKKPPALRFLAAGAAPLPDRTGALVAASFAM